MALSPPSGVNMQAIQQALARRQSGGATAPTDQMSAPGGTLPTGGVNTPTAQPMPTPTPAPGDQNVPPRSPGATGTDKILKAGQVAQSPLFDDETRKIAKALTAKLISVL